MTSIDPASPVVGHDQNQHCLGDSAFWSFRRLYALPSDCWEIARLRSAAATRSGEDYAKRIALQVLFFAADHNMLWSVFNAAKGGDPMSHGSAEGSVKFVRGLRF